MHRCNSICSTKDPKLLVLVRCTTRKFCLHQPLPERNDWYVRSTPPAIDGVRRVVFESTGTKTSRTRDENFYHSLKSPLCSSASVRLPRVIVKADHCTI